MVLILGQWPANLHFLFAKFAGLAQRQFFLNFFNGLRIHILLYSFKTKSGIDHNVGHGYPLKAGYSQGFLGG